MKNSIYLLSLLPLLLTCSVQAGRMKNFNSSGRLNFSNSSIAAEKMNITGTFEANNVTLDCGEAYIENLTANTGHFTFDRASTIAKSTLAGLIILILGEKITFSDCKIEKLVCSPVLSSSAEPEIILQNTIIEGDVEFKGSKGTVYCDSRSKILGKIINGIKKSRN